MRLLIFFAAAAFAGKRKKGKGNSSGGSLLSNVELNCGAPDVATSRWFGEIGEKIVGGTE